MNSGVIHKSLFPTIFNQKESSFYHTMHRLSDSLISQRSTIPSRIDSIPPNPPASKQFQTPRLPWHNSTFMFLDPEMIDDPQLLQTHLLVSIPII